MRLIYRGGLVFSLTRSRAQAQIPQPEVPPGDYQGLRYSRYGVPYIP
jgi:hypothetical protein